MPKQPRSDDNETDDPFYWDNPSEYWHIAEQERERRDRRKEQRQGQGLWAKIARLLSRLRAHQKTAKHDAHFPLKSFQLAF